MDIRDALVTFTSRLQALNVVPSPLRQLFSLLPLPEFAVSDAGKLSISIGGRGMDLIVTLRCAILRSNQPTQSNLFPSTHVSADHYIEVERIRCRIHSVEFSLHGTKHEYTSNSNFSQHLN